MENFDFVAKKWAKILPRNGKIVTSWQNKQNIKRYGNSGNIKL